MDDYEKIILCEVAREAINGRHRAWLAEQYKAEEAGNQKLADYANAKRTQLLDLRRGLRVAKFAENQRIINGDFEPKNPHREG